MTALALGVALGLPAAAGEPTATELVDRANELLRGSSSFARVTMTVETPSWKRELSIESWHKGRGLALVVVRSPPKDRGTATLRVGSQMWTWMPSVERVIKVPPTMMHSAWMGSDFTYEDMVKADSIVKDYTHRIVERVKAEGGATLGVIEALPR